MFTKPMEKLNVACLWHCEIVYYYENHLSSSFKNKMAFSYLSVNFLLCLFVSASCLQTSKVIKFLPLQERPVILEHFSIEHCKTAKSAKEFRVKSG